jgi:cytochrome c oxidase subunit III
MNFLRAIMEKPWVAVVPAAASPGNGMVAPAPTARLGLRFLLAAMSMLFFLLFVAYVHRMEYPDWRAMPESWLLWLNTAVLVASSAGLQWAAAAAQAKQLDPARSGVAVGGVMAFAFLAGQLLAWKQFTDLGYYSAANPANAFFYLVTGLHGLHLAGGMVALGRTAAKAWGGDDLGEIRVSVELCALYWHFLLAVWLAMFGLLLFT